MRSFVDQHRPRFGLSLKPGGGVDDITDQSFPVGRCAIDQNHRLTGSDRNPRPHPAGAGHYVHPFLDLQSGPDCPLCIVLVNNGGAEYGEHAVAHQLLDPTAIPFYDLSKRGVKRLDAPPHILRIGAVARRGKSNEVGKENRDDLALFTGVLDMFAQVIGSDRGAT